MNLLLAFLGGDERAYAQVKARIAGDRERWERQLQYPSPLDRPAETPPPPVVIDAQSVAVMMLRRADLFAPLLQQLTKEPTNGKSGRVCR